MFLVCFAEHDYVVDIDEAELQILRNFINEALKRLTGVVKSKFHAEKFE